MTCQQFRLTLRDLRKSGLKHVGDTGVQGASGLAQQRSVGRILHQSMLKKVSRMRFEAVSEEQAGVGESIERRSKLCLRLACHRHQHRMGEFPTDGRADLRYLLGRAQSVETRHQRSVKTCRDCQGRRRHRPNGPPRLTVTLRLQNRLCHLFDKEGNSISSFYDILAGCRWDELVPSDAVDHGVHVALSQPIERESSHMRSSDPWRLELRPKGYQEQDAKCPYPVYH